MAEEKENPSTETPETAAAENQLPESTEKVESAPAESPVAPTGPEDAPASAAPPVAEETSPEADMVPEAVVAVAASVDVDEDEDIDATKIEDPKEIEKIARSNRFRGKPGGRPSAKPGPSAEEESGLTEKVVFINRCAKVVKGGRRFSFSALIVVGDGQGQVGIGFGKANEVAECIRKANEDGRKNMLKINLEQSTIPHEVLGIHGSSKVFMRPASPGTGLIAGGGVRAVAEAAGVKDLLAKSLGSDNPSNVAKAALNGLTKLSLKQEYLAARGKN